MGSQPPPPPDEGPPMGPDGPGPGPGPGPGSGPSAMDGEPLVVNADFEFDAKFLKIFMSLNEKTRQNIGHRIQNVSSEALNFNVSSFVATCSYKGVSCQDSR